VEQLPDAALLPIGHSDVVADAQLTQWPVLQRPGVHRVVQMVAGGDLIRDRRAGDVDHLDWMDVEGSADLDDIVRARRTQVLTLPALVLVGVRARIDQPLTAERI
jgi:hypothetical protein